MSGLVDEAAVDIVYLDLGTACGGWSLVVRCLPEWTSEMLRKVLFGCCQLLLFLSFFNSFVGAQMNYCITQQTNFSQVNCSACNCSVHWL